MPVVPARFRGLPRLFRPGLVALLATGTLLGSAAPAADSAPVVNAAPVANAARAVTAASAATTTPAAAVRVANSCDQTPAPGHFACFAQRRTDLGFATRRQLAAAARSVPSGYGPTDLQSAYALAGAAAESGADQTVYVVDAYDDPHAEGDLAVYRAQYGLPACTTANGCFRKLNQDGNPSPLPGADAGWAGEIALDLAMVSAVCPRCKITLIESRDNGEGLFVAIKRATTLGAKFVSLSWGGSEDGSEPRYDARYLAPSGVVIAAATGDDSYAGGTSYPASSPSVVAVGGTRLTRTANARGWSESVWNSTTSGTGSGCSRSEPKPTWQSVVASATCTKRASADVSAVADPATGVAVYNTYGGRGWAVYGGTSASTPIITAIYALAGTPAAGSHPGALPYAALADLNDVTSGANGRCAVAPRCRAGRGWDGPTGLGTPKGIAAFTAAGRSANTVRLWNPGPRTGNVARATSLKIAASDSGSALTYRAIGLPSGLTFDSATGLISGTPRATGAYSVTVTAGDDTGATNSVTFGWTISAACSGNMFANPGFESGRQGWTMSSSRVYGASDAHHGRHLARLDGYGRTHIDRLARRVAIPAGCHATLRYYLRVTTAEHSTHVHDTLTLDVGGAVRQKYSNRNARHYVLRTLDLSRYAGRAVTLTWTGRENGSRATTFRIDDVTLALR